MPIACARRLVTLRACARPIATLLARVRRLAPWLAWALWASDAWAGAALPDTVWFPSADGRTELVGYLYMPASEAGAPPGRRAAVVMLHGRAGPYSSQVSDRCTIVARDRPSLCGAATLAARHHAWGTFWAERGYVALHVDSFGPRGRAHGFRRYSHGSPERADLDERRVRPLDAQGALAWLARRPDVDATRIGVQGWSNGGSTVLNVLSRQHRDGAPGFRAGIALYPGCGPSSIALMPYRVRHDLLVLLAGDDEEVAPERCRALLEGAGEFGANVDYVSYPGATHAFDDPSPGRQAQAGNASATRDAMRRCEAFFARTLGAPVQSR